MRHTSMSEVILEAENLCKSFGALTAVDNVSIEVSSNSLISIIGPNGAGKTTLFNLIAGKYQPSKGSIYFRDTCLDDLPEHRRVHQGIAKSFQITSIYPEMSVRKNIQLAVRSGELSAIDHLRRADKMDNVIEEANGIVRQVGLTDLADSKAENLSHGDKRRLDIGITIGTAPELLLLDEPMAGMGSEEGKMIRQLVSDLSDDMTVMMIEHDVDAVMDISDRIVVMESGQIIAHDTPDQIAENERVQRAYLRRKQV